MDGFDPSTSFSGEIAARYDDHLRGDEAETVAYLSALARGGPVLELAVGTGRIALPLAATGIRVDGIELSPDMIDRLRAKSGGPEIRVVHGDMSVDWAGDGYALIYLVFNTIFNLLTQEGQVRCFQNAARQLADDGAFVVEATVPNDFLALPGDQYVQAERVEADSVTLDVARFDRVTQILDESHVTLGPQGIRITPIATRYIWPSEMDLMARLAGLRLRERSAGWHGEAFDGRSARHVSVYGK
ncbi:MAG: Methyltransferase type 11 [Pseudonocardiales bacterium]|nr:Methyltransferase type 11 [Pseudonocardiales bacterium]